MNIHNRKTEHNLLALDLFLTQFNIEIVYKAVGAAGLAL